MNKNQQLYQWLKAKSKRGSALARQMGVTKQYISEVAYRSAGVSDRKWIEFQDAMACVEKMEKGQSSQSIEEWIDGFRACGESGWDKYDDPVGEWLKEDRGDTNA